MLASIIVLTFNQLEEATRPCIESLYRHTAPEDFELIVVDNNSSDGTQAYLLALKKQHSNVRLCLNLENRGFAGGNNDGLRLSQGDYVVLLNNDTLLTPGWLQRLCGFLQEHPEVGLVSPVTNYAGSEQKIVLDGLGPSNYVEFSGRYTAKHAGVFRQSERLSFFCVAMRASVFERVGPLDENFGAGMFEDDDYCLRILAQNLKIAIVEDCFVYHQGSLSFQRLGTKRYLELFEKNRSYFQKKHGAHWTFSLVAKAYLRRMTEEIQGIPLEADSRYPQLERVRNRLDDFSTLLSHLQTVESDLVDRVLLTQKKCFGARLYKRGKSWAVLLGQKIGNFLSFVRRYGILNAFVHGKERLVFRHEPFSAYPEHPLNVLANIETVVCDRVKETPTPSFSFIVTVKNEAKTILSFLDSIAQQSLFPNEMVIVDGGSTDGTVEAIQQWKITSPISFRLICPGQLNISQGRNVAIREARHDIVVLADAGCRYDPDFCVNLVAGFAEKQNVDLVCGLTFPEKSTGAEWIATDYTDYDFSDHLPSARAVAIKKRLWEQAGEFPEYLTHTGEDTLFMINYRRFSRCWAVAPFARVFWEAPADEAAADRLLWSYGRGDGESGYAPYSFLYRPVKDAQEARRLLRGTELVYNLGVLEGVSRRPIVDARRHVDRVVVVFSCLPFHYQKGKMYRAALRALGEGCRVVFVSRFRGKYAGRKNYFEHDFTLLDLCLQEDFFPDVLLERYSPHDFAYDVYQDAENWMAAYIRSATCCKNQGKCTQS